MGPRYTDQLELELLSWGPVVELEASRLGPDEVVALEGIGTFEGVSVRKRAERLLGAGKDLKEFSAKVHRESTRRGHASLSTSVMVFYEVRECSRLMSLLLVSPPFGSHLQESQRRSEVSRERLLIPAEVRGSEVERKYREVMDHCYSAYKELMSEGIEMEDARYVLPLSSATSLFSSISFEAYVHLLKKTDHFPKEVEVWSKLFADALRSVCPTVFESRMDFEGDVVYYPISNPFRPPDGVMAEITKDFPADEILKVLEFSMPRELEAAIVEGRWGVLDAYANVVGAMTVENLSLVALHQAIRHRTIPTAVESIHSAAERALKGEKGSIALPPSLKGRDRLVEAYLSTCRKLLELYEDLARSGYQVAAPYALPQSLRLWVIRRYSLFNLLYPTGFVATRTCSYAQWEERAIAYKLWREVSMRNSALASFMGEKCRHLGYCPEKSWCPIILKYFEYSDEEHEMRSKKWHYLS